MDREEAAEAPRELQLSPAHRSALKLQGQYMGNLRNMKPRQKEEVKAVRATKRIRAAIGTARKLR